MRPKFETHDVEGRVVVREVFRVAEVERHLGARGLRALARLDQHRLGDVDPRHLRTPCRGTHSNLAGAAREIEDTVAWSDARHVDELVVDVGEVGRDRS